MKRKTMIQKKKEKGKNKPYLVGITGSFGTGKSLVGSILQNLGFFVIDTDDIVASLLAKKDNLTSKITREFGTINKKELSDIVFKSVKKRKKLESIIHPAVKQAVRKLVSYNSKKILFLF